MPASQVNRSALVIDASIALKWLLPESLSQEALALLTAYPLLHVPDLVYPEIGNILWKRVRKGEITQEKAGELLSWLANLSLSVHPSAPLIHTALEIACGYGRTVYDSLYIALAVREGCQVVTADEKLLNGLSQTPLSGSLVLLTTL